MELVKKIKEAEAKAEQIVTQAKADAVKQAEDLKNQHQQALAEAEQQRKKTIEQAINSAKQQGQKQAEELKAQADRQKNQLVKKSKDRLPQAITRVTDYIKDK